MPKLTQERLKELLHYDSETGIFTSTTTRGRTASDRVAGSLGCRGYRRIGIDGVTYLESRLAWFYMEGHWPENDIDHINRIKSDNRWKNLRHVSRRCNMRNSNTYESNTSGITGVSWDESKRKWMAHIMVDGKSITIGRFKSKVDAARARWNAEKNITFQIVILHLRHICI